MLNKNTKRAYYMQISEALESMIRSGYFIYGQKLPTLTEMKDMFNISLKVAAQAYEDLNKKGFIFSKRGKGYFVTFYNHLRVDLESVHQLEAKLVYEYQMKKKIILFELMEVGQYTAKRLRLNEDRLCYHIKQYYGKDNHNVLLQEIFFPVKYYPNLEDKYEQYKTTPSIVMNGYRYNIDEFLNQFFAGQASAEQEVFLRLHQGDPTWRIETLYLSSDSQPIVFMNQYLSGEFVNMAVMIDVD